jgi:hypothetical protein
MAPQPPSNTILPRALSLPPPSLCEAGAGGAGFAGRSEEAIGGTVRNELSKDAEPRTWNSSLRAGH